MTYHALARAVRRFARLLLELNVRPEDRVALLLPNMPGYVIAYYAVLSVGATVVNLPLPFSLQGKLELLSETGASVLVGLDALLEPFVASPLPEGLRHVLCFRVTARPLPSMATGERGPIPIHDVDALLPTLPEWEQAPLPRPDGLAMLQSSSGTSGRARLVAISHQNLLANVAQLKEWNRRPVLEEVRVLCLLPFFQAFGCVIGQNLSIWKAYRMILVPRFDASSGGGLVELLRTWRPQSVPAVPAVWAALVTAAEGTDLLSSILIASSGGAPLPTWVSERYHALTGRRLVSAYGLTEATCATHLTPWQRSSPEGSSGLPLPGTDARLVDPEDPSRSVARGDVGELVVRGPQVARGYYLKEDSCVTAFRGGWLFTGDLATIDADGFLFLVDRKEERIQTSGFKIYPSEVEAVLCTCEGVLEACVVGLPDALSGEQVVAAVVLAEGVSEAPAWRSVCLARLSSYQVPSRVITVKSIPKSPTGKPLRRAVRALLETLLEEQRHNERQQRRKQT